MNSTAEAARWLRDAEACLASAERALTAQDYRVAVQNAQLCVEHSTKAVIAHFAEPLWRHDPSPQLLRLLSFPVAQHFCGRWNAPPSAG